MIVTTLVLALLAGAPSGPVGGEHVQITLVSPGEGDRRVMRYALTPGHTFETETTVWSRKASEAEPAQPLVVRSRGLVEAVTDGIARVRVDSQLEGLRDATKPLLLPIAIVEVEPTGRVRSVALGEPRDPSPRAAYLAKIHATRLWVLLAAAFPTEPIGQGAAWTRTWRTPRNGFVTEEVSTFVLLSREGEAFSLGLTVAEAADGLQSVRRPAGALVSFRRSAQVKADGNLGSLAFDADGKSEATLVVDRSIERETHVTKARTQTRSASTRGGSGPPR